MAAAAASAMFILRLESASSVITDAAALNATCLWCVAAASLIWSIFDRHQKQYWVESVKITLSQHKWELLYLSAITTTLANWIQTRAQRQVTAERASVIYAMDPVWGALWANAILGEVLSPMGSLGALIITLAAAANAIIDFGTKRSNSSTGKKIGSQIV
mmetsp:Transcript_10274/g.15773  ORF Transcript_10274/g.15773 Transcript_10274/m.15773 type:complete len:160 (+) Transcript_10274:679-1158(+)